MLRIDDEFRFRKAGIGWDLLVPISRWFRLFTEAENNRRILWHSRVVPALTRENGTKVV
jgi:hypothetical protein